MIPHPNCPRWLDNYWLPSRERVEYFRKSQFFIVNRESFPNDTKRKEHKLSSPNLAYFHNLQTTSFVNTGEGRNSTVPPHCTKLLENQAVLHLKSHNFFLHQQNPQLHYAKTLHSIHVRASCHLKLKRVEEPYSLPIKFMNLLHPEVLYSGST